MKNYISIKSYILISLFIFTTACTDNGEGDEQELITTLIYSLNQIGPSTDSVLMTFRDLDGDGGNSPVITVSGPLKANTAYQATLKLLNESVTPSVDITEDIRTEGTSHQFFFSKNGTLNIANSYTDTDANGKPVGISSALIASGPSSGKLIITLRHEPNKTAAGVSNGDITNAGGETDIEVSFDVEIK
ncbi:MAG: type 1 periplasmic binding fold superfamily protein [Saprospiraceae bacterium]|nr:type 1 periplasmic binding fold superfamily protein [Candidatus Vicinibacter affinis]